jgi:hypothetical protein
MIQIYKVYHWNRFFSPDRNGILLCCHCEERSNLFRQYKRYNVEQEIAPEKYIYLNTIINFK